MRTMRNEKMYEPYVTINWCPIDVKSIRENWSDDKCMEALANIGRWFEDRSIEEGWNILENLLSMEYEEDDDCEHAYSTDGENGICMFCGKDEIEEEN